MEEENPRNTLQKLLVFFISFFLGLFLFLSSFLFLYQNETIKSEISKKKLLVLSKKENIISDSKILTYEFKKLFLDEKKKDFLPPTWILRAIGFFVMWFGFTLFLISFKKPSNKLGFFTFIFCLFILFLSILISKIIIFFVDSGEKLKDIGKSKNMLDDIGNIFSKFLENLFNKDFWTKILGFEVDIYFFYFLLFILFLVLYFLFSHIMKKRPKKQEKSSFKKYDK